MVFRINLFTRCKRRLWNLRGNHNALYWKILRLGFWELRRRALVNCKRNHLYMPRHTKRRNNRNTVVFCCSRCHWRMMVCRRGVCAVWANRFVSYSRSGIKLKFGRLKIWIWIWQRVEVQKISRHVCKRKTHKLSAMVLCYKNLHR